MTEHGSDDITSRFPENLSEAQISEINEKAIPINKKKATKFSFSVFQYKMLILNIILRVNFTREAEIVTLTRIEFFLDMCTLKTSLFCSVLNNCQLPTLFTDFKIRYIKYKACNFLLH